MPSDSDEPLVVLTQKVAELERIVFELRTWHLECENATAAATAYEMAPEAWDWEMRPPPAPCLAPLARAHPAAVAAPQPASLADPAASPLPMPERVVSAQATRRPRSIGSSIGRDLITMQSEILAATEASSCVLEQSVRTCADVSAHIKCTHGMDQIGMGCLRAHWRRRGRCSMLGLGCHAASHQYCYAGFILHHRYLAVRSPVSFMH